ncbi:MAG: aromatic ring-hydroxylating dioxygenase subunit alpha [Anaerolineae bacterium]|jgi:phenylpropionate dioxygenase-like ring-hydroxylating dioxygenase large terminal subunit|nr:aromatic ring-hydroxylating dioxygenase subunit alpha [Anaerolineae bacterium]
MISDPLLINDWHPVASWRQLEDTPVLGTRLLGEDIVVWRCGAQALVWQDLCIHRGTRLSLGKTDGEALTCPYHGWRYGPDGRCVHIPAHPDQTPPEKARAKTYLAQVKYGLVWASLGQPQHDVPAFAEWDDPSYRKVLCGPYRVKASGPRIIENFLDVGHFPFVHEGILGDQAHPEIMDYQAEITPQGVVAQGVRVYQPDPYGTGAGDYVTYVYRALRPLTAYLLKQSAQSLAIQLIVTPHDLVDSTAWMWMAMNYGWDAPIEAFVAFQDRIFSQDAPIVQSQRPELLPLDLQAELHLKSDRTAIAYRKWLNQLGLTIGAA